MKTLILLRHAKSSWEHEELPDRERPLNERGMGDAPVMGKRMKKRGIEVQLIISSPSVRTMKTARPIADRIGYPRKEIEVDHRLYHATPHEMLDIIRGLPDELKRIMLVGHNTGLTELVNSLITDEIENVPTCGYVELKYDIKKWTKVGKQEPVSVFFDYPKRV
jgi:phosphohistidine phosphatase